MKLTKIILLVLIVLPEVVRAELFLMDEIQCVVCGPERNTAFTNSDKTWKQRLGNQASENAFIPLQEQIQSEIVQQQVITEKMPLDPDAVGKYVENLKKQLKMNDADLEMFFAGVGRTMLEGIELLTLQYTSEFFMHYKFKSQLIPTDDEIEEYFNEYPEFIEGYYKIQIARVPFEHAEKTVIEKQINAYVQDGTMINGLISWGNVITINADDLSDDQEFVTEMEPNQIHVQAFANMFELVKLVAYEPTKLKSLSERKAFIIEMLNRKKMEKMLQAYNETIKDFIDIISFSDAK